MQNSARGSASCRGPGRARSRLGRGRTRLHVSCSASIEVKTAGHRSGVALACPKTSTGEITSDSAYWIVIRDRERAVTCSDPDSTSCERERTCGREASRSRIATCPPQEERIRGSACDPSCIQPANRACRGGPRNPAAPAPGGHSAHLRDDGDARGDHSQVSDQDGKHVEHGHNT